MISEEYLDVSGSNTSNRNLGPARHERGLQLGRRVHAARRLFPAELPLWLGGAGAYLVLKMAMEERTSRPGLLWAAAACWLLTGGGCDSGQPVLGRSNVLLLLLDTVRADQLGLYGGEAGTSPFLDRLASEGIVFEQAVSPSAQTAPTMLSLLTGLYPHNHGLQYFFRTRGFHPEAYGARPQVAESLVLLGERFRKLGYSTGAVITNPYLDPEAGFDRGWDRYRYLVDDRASFAFHTTPAPEVNAQALSLFEEFSGRPTLLYLHYMDAHNPYRPPAEFRKQFAPGPGRYVFVNGPKKDLSPADVGYSRGLYQAEIRGLDRALEELFASLEQAGHLDDTLVVIASDHGEAFDEHGGLGHGWALYEELVHTPLLFWHPKLRDQSKRVEAPVSLVDVMPTLLELVGIESQALDIDGRSLAPYFRNGVIADGGDRVLYSELGEVRSARQGPRKLIRWLRGGPREESFDLNGDPGEAQPLADAPAWQNALSQALDEIPVPDAESMPPPRAHPGTETYLRQLGYID